MNKKFQLVLILAIFIVSSCSHVENQNLGHELLERKLASESDNCRALFEKITVLGKEYPANRFSQTGAIVSKRKELDRYYREVAESIKDVKFHPELPLTTEAKLVMDPHEALMAKVLMIRRAKRTVDLTYFLFDESHSAKLLLNEIRLAVKRGVKVRIMLDPVGSFQGRSILKNDDLKALTLLKGREILDDAGNPTGEFASVEIVKFNPIMNIKSHITNWYRWIYNLIAKSENKKPLISFGWNHRSHDKILLIDAHSVEDSMVMLGGRNISDNYFHLFDGNEVPVTDSEFIIKGITKVDENGDIRNLIEEQYNRIFYYMANANLRNHLFKLNRKVVRTEFKKMRDSSSAIIGDEGVLKEKLESMIKSNYLDNDYENSLVEVLNEVQNLSRSRVLRAPHKHKVINNDSSILKKITDEMDKAEKTIDIVSPYFWITDDEIEKFVKWLHLDPERKIRVASNSLFTNDLLPSQALIENSYQRLTKRMQEEGLLTQVELYNFGKADHVHLGGKVKYGFLHAKVYLFDGKRVILSTSNIDPISRHINSEVGAALRFTDEDSKNIVKMRQFVDEVMSKSTLKGSKEDEEIRNNPDAQTRFRLLKFVSAIIFKLNLHPLL